MKQLCLLFASCLLVIVAQAQQFKAGLIGGVATSQVDGDTYAGYDKAGIFAGGFVSKKFSPESKWTALFEITYIQKGSRKIPHPDKGDNTSYSLNLDYAEVPVLIKYNFSAKDSSNGRHKLALEAGLAFGALVRSKEDDASGSLPSYGIPFQKTDYSIIIGINYFLSKKMVFNARTEYSLVPVRRFGSSYYYQVWTYKFLKPGYYNNLLIFSMQYQF